MLHSRMLTYLDEVARCGSIRKAASRLNVASSAVNRQILSLEEELGTPIFERLRKRLRLTSTGELLIAHVRQTLKDHQRVRARIEDIKGLRRGEVTIATMGTPAAYILPRVLRSFRRDHPGVKVIARVMRVNDLVAAVVAGEVDLGFGFNLPPTPGMHVFSAVESRLGVVALPDHPMTKQATVSLAQCVGYPLIFPDESLTLRQLLDSSFDRLAVRVEPIIETNSVELMKQASLAGLGITFMNAIDIEAERRQGDAAFIPLRDRNLGPQILQVVHRANGMLDILPQLMADELKASLNEFGGEGV
jgi:DNA-binding transcriptional LysR family regulator